MKCRGRTILNEARFADITVTDALYDAESIDPPHRHAFAHLSVVVTGQALEVRDTVPVLHRPGTAQTQHADAAHTMYFANGARVITIAMPFIDVPERSNIHGLAAAASQVKTPDDARLFLRTARQHFVTYAAAPQWLVTSLRTFPWSSGAPLREAVVRAGVHQAHYDRAFRRFVGMSPREYRKRAKIARASRALLSTNASIAQISLDAGFWDQSHCTAAFTKALGLPPAAYRRIFAQTS